MQKFGSPTKVKDVNKDLKVVKKGLKNIVFKCPKCEALVTKSNVESAKKCQKCGNII